MDHAWILAISLAAGCAAYHDPRTPDEMQRDSDLWAHANVVRVTLSAEQMKQCTSLGLVNEQFGSGVMFNPNGGPMNGGTWEEKQLRLETARLGGNAAVLITPKEWSSAVSEWSRRMDRNFMTAGPMPTETRVIGEAYRCTP